MPDIEAMPISSILQFYCQINKKGMGKSITQHNKPARNKHVDKKSIQSRFKIFVENLEKKHSKLTSHKLLPKIHRFFNDNRSPEMLKMKGDIIEKLKICKICDQWNKIGDIVQCIICEDNYHKKCYNSENIPKKKKFVCRECISDGDDLKRCNFCNKVVKKTEKILTCFQCNGEFHSLCMQKQQTHCKICANDKNSQKQKNRKLTQTKLDSLFKSKSSDKQAEKLVFEENTNFVSIRKGCQFKAMDILTPAQVNKYKNYLLEVIKAKNMQYTQQLKDFEQHRQNINDNSLQFGVQNMSKQEEEEFIKHKKQPIGPFIFTHSALKGYDVIADKDIPKQTIICQYVGEVVTLRQCIELQRFSHNDSIMDLWIGRYSEQKLMLRPEKWTNIARFINGIGSNKQSSNLKTYKICFKGRPMVLLVSKRKISKGESLCYDYNAGGIEASYDTSHFV